MSTSDLPSPVPPASQKPWAMAERNKRKAAETRAQTAEQTVAVLRGRIDDLLRLNHEALEKLQIAQAELAKHKAMADDADGDIRRPSLGLHFDKASGVMSYTAGLAGFADQGRKPSYGSTLQIHSAAG
jgi:hypothetical protein